MSKCNLVAPTVAVSNTDMMVFVFSMTITLLTLIWMIALMYRAYAVSCNIKGAKAIGTFIVSLIGAEVLSKFAILLFYT